MYRSSLTVFFFSSKIEDYKKNNTIPGFFRYLFNNEGRSFCQFTPCTANDVHTTNTLRAHSHCMASVCIRVFYCLLRSMRTQILTIFFSFNKNKELETNNIELLFLERNEIGLELIYYPYLFLIGNFKLDDLLGAVFLKC